MNVGYTLSVSVLLMLPGTIFFRAARPGVLSVLPSFVDRIVLVGFWKFLLMLAATILPFVSWRSERIALEVSLVAYLFMMFTFVYVLPISEQVREEKAVAQSVPATLNGNMTRLVLLQSCGARLGLLSSCRKTPSRIQR